MCGLVNENRTGKSLFQPFANRSSKSPKRSTFRYNALWLDSMRVWDAPRTGRSNSAKHYASRPGVEWTENTIFSKSFQMVLSYGRAASQVLKLRSPSSSMKQASHLTNTSPVILQRTQSWHAWTYLNLSREHPVSNVYGGVKPLRACPQIKLV